MRVAVIGLGAMGAAIARRLERAGADLVVHNRSPCPTLEFKRRGICVARSASEAATGADVAITMLSDGPAVESVLLGEGGVLSTPEPPPRVVIDMSTIDVATSARVAERAHALGVAYLRAPVSGNPSVVAAGSLTILASGDADAFERSREVLEAIGPALFYLGSAEQARVMKLALNLMVAGLVELLAEALVLGEGNGLERTQMLDVISRSAVGAPLVDYKAAALIADDYSPTFSARLMHKDLRLVIDAANQACVPFPVAATVEQIVQECVESGIGELDFSVLVPRLQREAGLIGSLPAPRRSNLTQRH